MGIVFDRGVRESADESITGTLADDESITGTVARLGGTVAGIEYHWSTVFAV